ncbi:Retrovirus-related Pol polyprotein [Arachis hypogaea]|nr:Retrovirus-related Pol polyprotein [Arachis hypogaea]
MKGSDHVNAILNDLIEEYSSLITSFLARSQSIIVSELESLLIAHKSMVARFRRPEAFIHANLAQYPQFSQNQQMKGGFRGGFRGRGRRMHKRDRSSYSRGRMMQKLQNVEEYKNTTAEKKECQKSTLKIEKCKNNFTIDIEEDNKEEAECMMKGIL